MQNPVELSCVALLVREAPGAARRRRRRDASCAGNAIAEGLRGPSREPGASRFLRLLSPPQGRPRQPHPRARPVSPGRGPGGWWGGERAQLGRPGATSGALAHPGTQMFRGLRESKAVQGRDPRGRGSSLRPPAGLQMRDVSRARRARLRGRGMGAPERRWGRPGAGAPPLGGSASSSPVPSPPHGVGFYNPGPPADPGEGSGRRGCFRGGGASGLADGNEGGFSCAPAPAFPQAAHSVLGPVVRGPPGRAAP